MYHEPYWVGLLKAFYRVPWSIVKWFLRGLTIFVLMFLGIVGAGIAFLLIFLPHIDWTAGVLGGLVAFAILVVYYYTFWYLTERTTILDWLVDD